MAGVKATNTGAHRIVSLSPFTASLCLAGAWLVEGLSLYFRFETQATPPRSVLILIALCVALRLTPALRSRPWLTVPFDAFAAIVVILDFTLILPWQAQAVALPLADDAIHAFDLSLGFNHIAWMSWLNAHPSIIRWLSISYNTMIPQAVLIVILCLTTKRTQHLDRYLCAFTTAIVLTSAISAALPTRGIVAILDPVLRTTPAWPFAATDVVTYDALRSGALRDLIGVPKLGIVSFPSFHAASAVLATWAFWAWPAARYPAAVLNMTVAVATVGCGGHYVADVLVGCLVAACSIALAVCGSDFGYMLLERVTRHCILSFDGAQISESPCEAESGQELKSARLDLPLASGPSQINQPQSSERRLPTILDAVKIDRSGSAIIRCKSGRPPIVPTQPFYATSDAPEVGQ